MKTTNPLGYFNKIYIINLEFRRDRRREIEAELRKIHLSLASPLFELFPAVRPAERCGFQTIGAHGCFMSHLEVLRRAQAAGQQRIAIFEDDLQFSRAFRIDIFDIVASLSVNKWDIFFGGYAMNGDLSFLPGAPAVPGNLEIGLTHFVGFQSRGIDAAVQMLESLLTRPSGDPRGGPMPVDGAYNWVRRNNPELITRIAVPALAFQRSSRTDIAEPKWFDDVPFLRHLVAQLRKLKNRLY